MNGLTLISRLWALLLFPGIFLRQKISASQRIIWMKKELKILNGIVSGYFDFAEVQAMRHNPMYMSDYVEHLDNVLRTTGEKLFRRRGNCESQPGYGKKQSGNIRSIRCRICLQ